MSMAGTLITMANLANDPGFRLRLQAAMVTAGLNVASEVVGAQDTNTYQLRHALAVSVLNNAGGWLDRFAWAAAVDATVSGEPGAPVAISSSTAANPSVITTAAAHGLTTGQVTEISNHLVNLAANGTWQVTMLTATTFSIGVAGTGAGGATGQSVKQPLDADIQNAVNSAFSDIAGVGVTT